MPKAKRKKPEVLPPAPVFGTHALEVTEQQKLCIHAVIAHGKQEAMAILRDKHHLDEAQVRTILQSVPARRYLSQYSSRFLIEMARWEVNTITSQLPVSRAALIGRLMALALTPPSETRGTIEGQVAAIAKIAEIMGLNITARTADDFFKGKSPEELKNYAMTGNFDPKQKEDTKNVDPAQPNAPVGAGRTEPGS